MNGQNKDEIISNIDEIIKNHKTNYNNWAIGTRDIIQLNALFMARGIDLNFNHFECNIPDAIEILKYFVEKGMKKDVYYSKANSNGLFIYQIS